MSASLNQIGEALGNNQFLFDDGMVLALSLTMLYTGPAARLGKVKAQDNLFSFAVLGSVLGQVSLCVVFFAVSWVLLYAQPWFCSGLEALNTTFPTTSPPLPPSSSLGTNAQAPVGPVCYPINRDDPNQYLNDLVVYAYENNVTWLYTHFQFWIVAIAFNMTPLYFLSARCWGACWGGGNGGGGGRGGLRRGWHVAKVMYRQPMYRNGLFMVVVVVMGTCLSLYLLLGDRWLAVAGPFSIVSRVSSSSYLSSSSSFLPPTQPTPPQDISLPLSFRWTLYAMVWLQFAIAMVWEVVGVPLVDHWLRARWRWR